MLGKTREAGSYQMSPDGEVRANPPPYTCGPAVSPKASADGFGRFHVNVISVMGQKLMEETGQGWVVKFRGHVI